jgi:hypothetical protein
MKYVPDIPSLARRSVGDEGNALDAVYGVFSL